MRKRTSGKLASPRARSDPGFPRRRHVALIVPMTRGYCDDVVAGILEYAEEHESWRFKILNVPWHAGMDLPVRPGDPCDGVIAYVIASDLAQKLRALQCPVVNVCAARQVREFPLVTVDDFAVGRMAAEHLLDLGFRSFAYLGWHRVWFAYRRCSAFARRLREAGHVPRIAHVADHGCVTWPECRRFAGLAEWLETLPRPTGLFCCLDFIAREAIDLCADRGIRVPQDIAFVSCDNETMLCGMSKPPLTSVDIQARRIGYRAAELLAGLMHGKAGPRKPILFRPTGIVVRRSTDLVATADETVRNALLFIRDHADKSVKVRDVLKHVGENRRRLERLFRKTLGHGPHEEIVQARVERARQMLASKDRSIADVARACGFKYPDYFSVFFRRETGVPPEEYRRSIQAG
jgi:LacI family transcriptional regulator